MHNQYERIEKAVKSLRQKCSTEISHLLVLGTGLGGVSEMLNTEVEIEYKDIEGFPVSTAPTHKGRLLIGELAGHNVAIMQGRMHIYEGNTAHDVVLPIQVMKHMGAKSLIITNAAGALNPEFKPTQIMLIEDHLNFTGVNPLIGPDDERLGLRFPDMSDAYSKAYRQRAIACLEKAELPYHQGIYAGVTGPSLETFAECRFLRSTGADAVGMSTVLEVIAAVQAGYEVLGITAITDRADGAEDQPPVTAEEIIEKAHIAGKTIMKLIPLVLTADTL